MSQTVDYASSEEETLVRAAQGGDMAAFEELVARHRDKVYSRAYSILRNEEEAVEVSQQAWIKVWQRREQFQGGSKYLTWVTRIVINLALDRLRKMNRWPEESIEKLQEEEGGVERRLPVAASANPTEGLERRELRERVDEALAQLSVEHRTAIVLHEFEGLEYKEIARRMNCSLGTVMSRLFYGRRRLAALLRGMNLEEYR